MRSVRPLRCSPLLLFLAAGAARSTTRAPAAPPQVASISTTIDAVSVREVTQIHVRALDSLLQGLPSVPVTVQIQGDTGNNSSVTVTTDDSGAADYSFQPLFSGLIQVTAFYDANSNHTLDPGEPSGLATTIAYQPPNNRNATLAGSGATTFADLIPGIPTMDPLLGTFQLKLKTGSTGKPQGYVRLDVPDLGLHARSSSITGFFGADYNGYPGATVLGTMKVGGHVRPFRMDAWSTGMGVGHDALWMSFQGPSGLASWSGGTLLSQPGLDNSITYGMGTVVPPDQLQVFPHSLNFGTVTPQQFHPMVFGFVNIGPSTLTGSLDVSHASSVYFHYQPPAGPFSLAPGVYWNQQVLFYSRGPCTHHGYLQLNSSGLTGGSLKIPISVRSSF